MWRSKLFLVCVTLGLLVLCLGTRAKAKYPLNTSGLASRVGQLLNGNNVNLISNQTKLNEKVNDGTRPQDGLADDTEDYQSDQSDLPAWHKMESKLMSLNPSVLCGDDAMILHLHGDKLPNFMINDGDGGSIALTEMPASCGFSVKQGLADVFVIIFYDCCHVIHQEDRYVLLMYLWGAPISISCPVAFHEPPTVFCFPSHMVTKFNKSADNLKLKVNGVWEPLMEASSKCDITTESLNSEVVIATPYQSSCWQMKDNERLLSLQNKDEEWILSCHNVSFGHAKNDQTLDAKANSAKQPVYPFPQMHYPYLPMYYQHMYDRYPWAVFPNTASNFAATTVPRTTTTIAVPATSTSTSKTKTLANQKRHIIYPFPHMYYPFRPMHHRNPMHYWYPWANPTTITTTTVPTTATTISTTKTLAIQNRDQMYPFYNMYYPFGPYHHHNPRHHRAPWANPKTITTTITSVPTTSTTSSITKILASQLRDAIYPFPYMYYPFKPMYQHHNPMDYRDPWANPNTKTTTTTAVPTTSTKSSMTTTLAKQNQDLLYPFPHMYYPFGPMYHHQKPMHYRYPWESPTTTIPTTAVPPISTTSTKPLSNQEKIYPFGPMYHHHKPMHYRYPWTKPKTTTKTAVLTTASMDSITINEDKGTNPAQMHHETQGKHMYSPFGHVYHPHKPMQNHGSPRALPTQSTPAALYTMAPMTTAATTTQTVTSHTISNKDPQKPLYSLSKFYPIAYMPYHHRNPFRQNVHAWSPNTLASTSTTKSAYTAITARHPQPKQRFHHKYDLLFDPMHRRKHQTPWVSYSNHHDPSLQEGRKLVPASSTRTTINCVK